MGGIFVRTDRLEEVGEEIFIDLVKPGWKRQLTLTARVTSRVDALDGRLSRRMPGMGIQFLRLDEKQHDRLRSLLRELGAPDEDLEVTLPDKSAEEEASSANRAEARAAARAWEAPHSLMTDIELALREANFAPPGPVVLAPEKPPKMAAPGPDPSADTARLMLQIRGLVMQLSETQLQLSQREQEIGRLKDELETLRSALERSVRNA